MQLLNLPDEPLAKIFKYLDKGTKLQLMTVCKRFERLIGKTDLELLKGFILYYVRKICHVTNPPFVI